MPENTDLGAQIAREIREKIEDNSKLVEEAFFNSPPIKLIFDGDESMVAPAHSHHLLDKARNALEHNNTEEAAHQLRREVDFCNMVPKMTGTVYETTGKTGLEALANHKTAVEICRKMEKTWEDGWTKEPAPFYKRD